MLTDLSNLRPVPALEDKIEFGERFADLDRLLAEAAGGTPSIQEPCYEGSHDLTPWNSLTERLGRTAVNWNVVLRTYNSTFDQVVEALHRSTRSDRRTALGEVFVRLGYNEKFHERWQSLVWSTIVHGRRATSLEVARNRLILGYMLFSPDFDIQDRTAMQLDLTKLAFALAAYHADHGSYPAKLDELAHQVRPRDPQGHIR